ncbi:MAG: methyltransferase domain-containing protein, partial [Candidatus Andersenbacteria bacterium]
RTMYSRSGDFTQYEKQSFWSELKNKFQKNGRYLDAGCGIGGWILFLSESGYTVDGIDAHPQAVRAMTEFNPDLSVKIAGSDAIPFADNTFNGVLSIGSLEYTQDSVEKSLIEFHRVLKKDGFLCVEVPLLNTLRTFLYVPLKYLESIFMNMSGRQATFAYYLFGRNELEDMLMNAGFAIEAVIAHDLPDEDSHFGLYANWPFLRGAKPYELNMLGKIVKAVCNVISPWIASAGIVVIAKKK